MQFHRTDLIHDQGTETRPVILHFHTFKNAGTSVDAILQKCFPEGWANFDGPVPEFFIHHSEMELIARNRRQLRAISSHQIRLPVPGSSTVEFLPIVFIRRPELRIASIWRFQRQRNDDHPATVLAKELEFKEWVERNLEPRARLSIRNNQAHIFSFRTDRRTKRNDPRAFDRAKANFEALPLMGVVERFDDSMSVYERLYSPHLPEFHHVPAPPKNTTGQSDLPVSEQLEAVRNDLGDDLYARLQEANTEDIALYEMAVEALERRLDDE